MCILYIKVSVSIKVLQAPDWTELETGITEGELR